MGDQEPEVVLSLGCRSLQLASRLSAPLFSGRFTLKQEVAGRRITSASLKDWHPHHGPFAGITLCVTGLSKDAREQVKFATERLGGTYSPDLHPQCTHLVVQNFSGRKLEHALKHGMNRGLYVVTLSWFLNSAKLNVRLDESLYTVENALATAGASPERLSKSLMITGAQSCLPIKQEEGKLISLARPPTQFHPKVEMNKQRRLFLTGFQFYMDPDISTDIQNKVCEIASQEGATFTDDWYLGCSATHVLCEGTSLMKYVGYSTNLVSPWWLLKTVKEGSAQHLVQFSSDLARQLVFLLDYACSKSLLQVEDGSPAPVLSVCGRAGDDLQAQIQEREERIKAAKDGVRRRRGARLQPCRTLPRPITPSILLETVCWSVTEPTSTARLYLDSSADTSLGNGSESRKSGQALALWDIHESGAGDASSSAFSDAEAYTSEKLEIVYTGVFLTILFPIDRYNEMGLSSKTYFNERGFTRHRLLDMVYAFYQGLLSDDEIQVAIHTDSKHADKLRMLYISKETIEKGCVAMKRADFLGSRRNFEGLKRTSRENTGQVYELLLGS
ncbi:hypothetical protein O6H91_01G077700 [Diphasiastrum complanatum]|uniref:Uncharacterized protein n=1 Tax=Diphasiastrum complanatum TaxID=34168 RepID=A0ACC2ESJ9_DIPCM|nr:hypothetical protein O6H91_Y413000 [Diphasiastrum complanatum]KAJ7569434.1 hypothetical protein O6H91_01G077700 [Diphasiastrum complanatum]